MSRIYFVHWNESEATEVSSSLRADGHELRVHFATNRPPSWEGFEPDVAVISLERLPAHGREIADWIRSAKKRRHVPVVFVGGKQEKVTETRSRFPDATFCGFDELSEVVRDIAKGRLSTATAPEASAKTTETAKRPSATPLAVKLGISEGKRFKLLEAPNGFHQVLSPPSGAIESRSSSPPADVLIYFARSSRALTSKLPALKNSLAPTASLWLAWPKKTSALASDLSDEVVRQMGLRIGLVDVKVCAIDETWSGLKFMHRIADRPKKQPGKAAKK